MTKRCLDIVVSAAGLATIAPLLLAIALAIYVRDGTSPIFRQTRVGRGGRCFVLFKFRTMRLTGDPDGVRGDRTRITPLGGWLRRTKFDELPQLLNVLLGDMSLVGPRPELPQYVRLYSPQQRRVFQFRPGISDPAAVDWADESNLLAASTHPERTYIEQILPAKLACSMAYASRATLLTDLHIIAITLALVLRRQLPGARTTSTSR